MTQTDILKKGLSIFFRFNATGIGDHIVTWSKPKRSPNGMSADEFASFPDQFQGAGSTSADSTKGVSTERNYSSDNLT